MASIPSFIFGGDSKYKTQEELEAAREQVRAMLGDIGQSGLTGWGSAMADLGKGIGARIEKGRIGEGQEFLTGEQSKLWDMFGSGGGGAGTDVLVGGGGADSMAGGAGGDMTAYQNAIAKIESGGNYKAVGPTNPKLGRALGKYQIMEANIGPWSRKHLGREVTPQEFLANPAIQDAIFNGEFAGYVSKYGPEGAAQAWIGGPGAVGKTGRKDVLGTSVGEYGQRFMGSLAGGGGANAQAGGGAGDSFLQAKPRRRMTPAMLEQEAGTEKRPIWDNGFSLQGRRRMTPAMGFEINPEGTPLPDPGFEVNPQGQPLPDPGFEVNPASPLDGRRRMTPAMINPQGVPAPAPMPAPDPARFGPTPPVPVAAPLQAPNPDRFAPAPFVSPQPAIYTQPAAPRGNRLGNPPPAVVPGQSMAGTERAPPMPAPRPAPPPAPVQAPAPVPTPVPAPAIAKVDPFTDMILGDQAKNYRPGGYIPPAPVASAFPAAPPAPGTPAAAGFGVPQQAMAGGGGSNTVAGGGGGQFPPVPAAPAPQQAGGGDKIAKLMFIMGSPYASKEQKLMAASMLEREYALQDETRKANSPDAVLNRELTTAQIAKAKADAAKGETQPLVNAGDGNVYDPNTDTWHQAPAGEGGGAPFKSKSVEAEALNGMVKNGTLTLQQAYDLAAGKTITAPDGRIIFMSGTDLVGGKPGGQMEVIQPAADGQGAGEQTPILGADGKPLTTPSGRVLTGPKPSGGSTDSQRRNQSLYHVVKPELKIVEDNFAKLANIFDQGASMLPGGDAITNDAYEQARNALEVIVTSYLYSMSGQAAPVEEVRKNVAMLTPRAFGGKAAFDDKLRRIRTFVEAIQNSAGPGVEGGVRPPDTSNAGPRKTKTGVTWSG